MKRSWFAGPYAVWMLLFTVAPLIFVVIFAVTDKTGVFSYENLVDEWSDNFVAVDGHAFKAIYKAGKKNKTPFVQMVRKMVWRKRFWCTEKFNHWLEEFKPECVFLSFSDDFFIPEIALYVAQKFNIPIISSIGDDYFFNDKKTLSPIYYIYKYLYRKCIRRVFSHGGSAIYIGNKIRDKYNKEFV